MESHAADLEGASDRLPINQNATLTGHFQSGREFHEGRFASPRRTDNGNKLTLVDGQVDVFDRIVFLRQELFVVGEPYILEIDKRV